MGEGENERQIGEGDDPSSIHTYFKIYVISFFSLFLPILNHYFGLYNVAHHVILLIIICM
jgi:hypothetical protein